MNKGELGRTLMESENIFYMLISKVKCGKSGMWERYVLMFYKSQRQLGLGAGETWNRCIYKMFDTAK